MQSLEQRAKNLTKHELFGYRTSREIKEGRRLLHDMARHMRPVSCNEIVTYLHMSDIIDKIESLNSDQYLIMSSIIPKDYENGNNVRFRKRGEMVILPRFTSSKIKDDQITPKDLYGLAVEKLKEDIIYGGIVFRSPFSSCVRRTSLDRIITGHMLFSYAKNSKRTGLEVKKIHDRNKDIVEYNGGIITVNLPSKDAQNKGDKRWDIAIKGFPLYSSKRILKKGDEAYPLSFHIHSQHDCGTVKYAFSYRYREANDLCDHVVAAVDEIISYQLESNNKVPYELNPFPVNTQFTLDFYKRLLNNVIVTYRDQSWEKRSRRLDWGEREILLWEHVKKNGFVRTLDTNSNPKTIHVSGNTHRRPKINEYDYRIRSFPSK